MGEFKIFCAGASVGAIPGIGIDNLFLNAVTHGKDDSAVRDGKLLIAASRPRLIALDSGGFQFFEAETDGRRIISDPTKQVDLGAGGVNLTPERVIEVATQLRPDILMSLDWPLRRTADLIKQDMELLQRLGVFEQGSEPMKKIVSSDNVLEDMEFMRKLGFSIVWGGQCLDQKNRYCPEVRLFLPVQVYNIRQLEEFLSLASYKDYDGLSFPARHMLPTELPYFLLRLYRAGVKNVHILGVSSYSVLITAAHFARNHFDWLSMDATSWSITARGHGFYNPHDLSVEKLSDDVHIDPAIINDCPCVWCREYTFSRIRNLDYTDKTRFLMSHNFAVTELVAKELYKNAGDLDVYRRHLKGRSRNWKKVSEIVNILYAIEHKIKKGVQTTSS